MKKALKIIGIVLVAMIVIIAGGLFYLSQGLSEGEDVTLIGWNLEGVEDGVYQGSFNFKRWSNTLKVTVEDEKIVEIEVVDDVTFVRDGVSSQLFDAIIDKQDIPEDLVSEATITSKAYIKAIEDALIKE